MPATRIILKAALIVGTLDILAACTQFYFKTGKAPFRPVLTFVASGLVGKEAFTNGDIMMLAGLLIHYCIATAFTLFFFYTVARLEFAREYKLLTGMLYGAFVWTVMNLLVLPLTNANRLPKTFWGITIGMLILICCIGIPLAYLANRNYSAIQKHHTIPENSLQ